MSARGLIAGDHILTAEIAVTGRATQTVLFRAIGPDLIRQGVDFAMRNPTLALYDQDWNFIAGNVNWRSDQELRLNQPGWHRR